MRSINLYQSASGVCTIQLLSRCDWLSQKEQAELWGSLSGTRLFPEGRHTDISTLEEKETANKETVW